jgi:hypothetical protein
MARVNLRLKRPRVTQRVLERYGRGHVETVQEYLNRGGQITTAPMGVSSHRVAPAHLIEVMLGANESDVERGVGLYDVDAVTRAAIRAPWTTLVDAE